ncbi:MAG TPA: CBS domain-containing protein, partial [Magnetospirillaceae bacterium]|nr:CBS domain-containing protein [Magnetospirillaceae bacterium]
MTLIQHILRAKKKPPVSVNPDDTVYTALEAMAKHNIGAVLVMDGKRLIGILSERDYARKVVLKGRLSKDTLVREIMSGKVHFATPDQSVDDCLARMTAHKFRHMPVMDAYENVIGVVSIGDLVKEKIS